MKVVAYLRVSTPGQAADGISLGVQHDRVLAWRDAHHPLAPVVSYEDAGISGSVRERPGLEHAMAQLGAGDVLVVYSLSRLARSTSHTLELAEQLDHAGADLVSLSESIDTTSAAGKMVFRMLAVLAEFERDLVSERTKSAMAHLRATGRRFTRHEPYPQATIDLVQVLRATGLSYRAICRELTSSGIATRLGGPWRPGVVQRLAGRAT